MTDNIAERLRPWGNFQVEQALPGGFRNRVYLVRCGSERFVAKTTTRTEAQLCWLVDVLQAADDVGIVTPSYLQTQQGQLCANGMTIESWIDGTHPEKAEMHHVAALLDTLHQATRTWRQRPRFTSSAQLQTITTGGDVALDSMPPALVALCRARWALLADEPESLVHGDPGRANVLRLGFGRYALIDWDEARVDKSIFDMVGMLDANPGYAPERWHNARQAADAWEVAVCWEREPAYARRLAENLF